VSGWHSLRSSLLIDQFQRSPETVEFAQAEEQIHDAKPGYGTADEIVQEKVLESKRVAEQDIMFPESRPWNKDQEQTDLEAEKNEGDCEKAIHEMRGQEHKRHKKR
jgi:hypothetical protein